MTNTVDDGYYQNTPPEVREARLLAAAAAVDHTNTVDD